MRSNVSPSFRMFRSRQGTRKIRLKRACTSRERVKTTVKQAIGSAVDGHGGCPHHPRRRQPLQAESGECTENLTVRESLGLCTEAAKPSENEHTELARLHHAGTASRTARAVQRLHFRFVLFLHAMTVCPPLHYRSVGEPRPSTLPLHGAAHTL